MTAIITSQTRTFNAARVKSAFGVSEPSQYLFIGKPTAWANDNIPDQPADSLETVNNARRDMTSLKRIMESDTALGIYRRNWAYGKYYDFYRHDYGSVGVFGINLDTGAPTTPGGLYEANFFVMNDQYGVYKCMWNANGAASTVMPTGTSTEEFSTADGYVWKYMYTISSNDAIKFVTSDFIPVKTLESNPGSSNSYYSQWLVQDSAIGGRINRAVVMSRGTGYPVSTTIPVTVKGDGTGAVANALTNSSGQVSSIVFTSAGAGYSWAEIEVPAPGSGVVISVIASPAQGHGYDPVSELGGFFVIINTVLTPNEGADFIVSNEYRKVGILRKPTIFGTTTPLVSSTAAAYYKISVNSTTENYLNDETVSGVTSGASATLIKYSDSGVLAVYKERGDSGNFTVGENIVGATSGAVATITQIVNPEVDVWTGEVIYLEHRLPVSRQDGQEEDIKIVIEC